MYVALTRARRLLYLSLAQSRMLHGQTRYNIPSRFFQEIPENLMRRVSGGTTLYATPHTSASNGRRSANTHGGGSSTVATYAVHAEIPWKIGQNVTHSKFGSGVIVNAEGRGAEARVQVNFRNSGLKWLMLEYAKLTSA
jgi:DNA helicase-2/ATP-dependent DNA helicase PcrA